MSSKYPGGIISKTAPTPSGPYADSTAPGIWTLEQQAYWQKLGQWPTQGNVNPSAFIENLFSTYIYAGTGSTQTITNGIDLSTNGGLVWVKRRGAEATAGTGYHALFDTARGAYKKLETDSTAAQSNWSSYGGVSAFNSNGFSLIDDTAGDYLVNGLNTSGTNNTYASWTFRKQAKFFDIVTYTGNGGSQTINHNLGATPGCIIIKKLDSTTFNAGWAVYHRSLTNPSNYYLVLDTTAAEANYGGSFISNVGATSFDVAGASGLLGLNGSSYIAYLFAHNAGGFGLTGSDNVISCGSFTTDGSGNATVSLGYEPQWVLIKYNSNDSWRIFDNMRGMSQTNWAELYPNTSAAEVNRTNQTDLFVRPNATGFTTKWSPQAGNMAIYIAIRRGPMAVPTLGTSVFYPQTVSQANSINSTNVPFAPDLVNTFSRDGTNRTYGYNKFTFQDRLRGLGLPNSSFSLSGPGLIASDTAAEDTTTAAYYVQAFVDGINITRATGWNDPSYGNWIYYFMRRAPSFFDVVCYTGTGSTQNITHNLGVAPELWIVKKRSSGTNRPWRVGNGNGTTYMALNSIDAEYPFSDPWNNTAPTSSVFTVGVENATNESSATFVAYLFATCAGVSKVGSYTGTGTTKQVDCGFTGGARFVLIKRTDSTGDWYVWDSARGIVSGNDPYLLLNSSAVEVTSTDYVDTYSAGFEISSTAPSAINANGGTFIFLAIA